MQVDGSWIVAVSTPVGRQEVVFRLKTVNGRIEGTATQGEEVVPFENVVREGNRLRWALRVTRPFKMHIRYDVTIEGDKMAGTAKAGIFPTSKLSGERQLTG